MLLGLQQFFPLKLIKEKKKNLNSQYLFQCRCLTNLGSETNPYPRACTNNHNQLWKLNRDNTLWPKDDTYKCPFLIEPGNSDLSSGF